MTAGAAPPRQQSPTHSGRKTAVTMSLAWPLAPFFASKPVNVKEGIAGELEADEVTEHSFFAHHDGFEGVNVGEARDVSTSLNMTGTINDARIDEGRGFGWHAGTYPGITLGVNG